MAFATVYGPTPFTVSTVFNPLSFLFASYTEAADAGSHFTITTGAATFDVYGSFTYADNPPTGSEIPSAGTITRIDLVTTSGDHASFSGFSITLAQLQAALSSSAGLFNALSSGDDNVTFSITAFDPANHVDMGVGMDSLSILGSSASAITLNNNSIQNVETLYLGSSDPFNHPVQFNITMADGNVAAGAIMTVFDNLGAKGTFTFNGGAETDGRYNIVGNDGADNITTGAGNDSINTGGNFDTPPNKFVGNDIVSTGAGNDTIAVIDAQITASTGDGDDTINIGAYFEQRYLKATDAIDGGAGNDTLVFAAGGTSVKLGAATVVNVETFRFSDSNVHGNYNITTSDATVAAGATLTVDAGNVYQSGITFNGTAETDGSFHFIEGGSFQDPPLVENFSGGAGNDVFDSSAGGSAAVVNLNGGGGNDTFNFTFGAFGYNVKSSGAHVARDSIIGGAGNDTLNISGDYSTQLAFQTNTLQGVETIVLGAGNNYSLLLADAPGAALKIDATALDGFNSATLNASLLTGMAVDLEGGAGNDALTGGGKDDLINGGGGNDTIDITKGGKDIVHAGDGDDTINAGSNFNASDSVDGGAGTDTLVIAGPPSGIPIAFGGVSMTGVETLSLAKGSGATPFIYHLQLNDTSVATASGQVLTVDGTTLLKTDTMDIDGSHVHSGSLQLLGSAGADTLTGGTMADTITGGSGIDHITGGGGQDMLSGGAAADVFVYIAVGDSTVKNTSNNFDHVTDFDFAADKFDFTIAVSGVDAAVTGVTAPVGGLIAGALKTDLAGLGANHAVLYTSTDAHLYLVVDANGTVGFQANADYVIDVTGAVHATAAGTNGLDVGDFI